MGNAPSPGKATFVPPDLAALAANHQTAIKALCAELALVSAGYQTTEALRFMLECDLVERLMETGGIPTTDPQQEAAAQAWASQATSTLEGAIAAALWLDGDLAQVRQEFHHDALQMAQAKMHDRADTPSSRDSAPRLN